MTNSIPVVRKPITTLSASRPAVSAACCTCLLAPTTKSLSTRRAAVSAAVAAVAALAPKAVFAFEFGMTAPDQTLKEAQAGMRVHGQGLLAIKTLLDEHLWKEAQVELRENAGGLKQDIYTMIQAAPVQQRPELRKLYSSLFNNVTRLDYAARSKDESLVQEHYQNMVDILSDIITKF